MQTLPAQFVLLPKLGSAVCSSNVLSTAIDRMAGSIWEWQFLEHSVRQLLNYQTTGNYQTIRQLTTTRHTVRQLTTTACRVKASKSSRLYRQENDLLTPLINANKTSNLLCSTALKYNKNCFFCSIKLCLLFQSSYRACIDGDIQLKTLYSYMPNACSARHQIITSLTAHYLYPNIYTQS